MFLLFRFWDGPFWLIGWFFNRFIGWFHSNFDHFSHCFILPIFGSVWSGETDLRFVLFSIFFFRPVVEIDFYDWFLGQYFGVELVIFDQVWVFISFRLLANLWLFWPISGSFLDPLKIPIQFWFYFLIQYQSVFFNGSVSISWSNSFWLVFSRILVPSFWLFLTNFHLILLQVFEASNAIFRLIMIDFQTNFVVDLDGTFNVLRLSLGQFE